MDMPNLKRLHELLLADERESTVARVEAFYRKAETEAVYARACELRDHYDAEFNRIHEAIRAGHSARLTDALQQAQTQSAFRAMNLLQQLNQVRALVARDCNHALGNASPYWNDEWQRQCERDASYETLCDLRQWEPPEYIERAPRKQEPEAQARASVQQQTRTQPATHQRNDLTRRSEGCEEREECRQSMSACWHNAERMTELVHRVDEAYAELLRQARVLKKAASQVTEPLAPRPEPVDGSAMRADPFHRLTPLQQAALSAIGHWLFVIGNCGSTKLTAGGSTTLATGDFKSMAQARRQRRVQAGRLRSKAGP
jgi:hypothetical protein